MEKQYIGARYVPILGGSWDKLNSYEALTIVQANNNSYTSKKPVPPGIEITNTEYWVLTGNFNGQVEEYRQQVETLSQNLTALDNKVTDLDEELSNEMAELSKKVENATKRRFIFIGDSYARDIERDGVFVTGWPARVVEELGLSNTDAYIQAISGAGFTSATGGMNFLQGLEAIYSSVTTPQTITDIFVVGGYNDRLNAGSISAAVDNFVARAKTLFPAATVTLGFVGRNTMRDRQTGLNLYNARAAYIDAPKTAYINRIEYAAPLSTMYTSDNVHPNNDGEVAIANAICKYIRGGATPNKFRFTTQVLSGNAGYTNPTATIAGDTISLILPNLSVSEEMTGDFDYGKLETTFLYSSLFGCRFPVVQIVTRETTENVYVTGVGYLYVDENRHLRMNIFAQKAGGGQIKKYNYLSVTNQTVTLPCEYFL